MARIFYESVIAYQSFIDSVRFLAFSVNGYAAPALFKIEKQGASSYLFGTVHVGDASMKGLPKK
nr:TraB/GumN family protein [Ningiella sp. W23]